MHLKNSLEPVMQSEVSQKEKDRYHMLTHTHTHTHTYIYIYMLEKNDTERPICKVGI